MLLQNLKGQIIDVDLGETYIKPFYTGNKITSYALCSNENNEEVVIETYTNKLIIKYMFKLLEMCNDYSFPVELLPEVRLAEDLVLQANARLVTVKRNYLKKQKEEVNNGGICGK